MRVMIHNSGCNESRHDGIHTFMLERMRTSVIRKSIMEMEMEPSGRALNPVTNIYVGENSVFTLDTAQIKGVDSTVRETLVEMDKTPDCM